eukprot:7204476-Prymnesium_polylepis.1
MARTLPRTPPTLPRTPRALPCTPRRRHRQHQSARGRAASEPGAFGQRDADLRRRAGHPPLPPVRPLSEGGLQVELAAARGDAEAVRDQPKMARAHPNMARAHRNMARAHPNMACHSPEYGICSPENGMCSPEYGTPLVLMWHRFQRVMASLRAPPQAPPPAEYGIHTA